MRKSDRELLTKLIEEKKELETKVLSKEAVAFYEKLAFDSMQNLENGKIIQAHGQIKELWQHFYLMKKN